MVENHPCAGCASIAECEHKDNKDPDFWCGPHGPTILRERPKPPSRDEILRRYAQVKRDAEFARFLISALELRGTVTITMDRDLRPVVEGVILQWVELSWWRWPLDILFTWLGRRRVRRFLEKSLPSDCMFVEVKA